MVATDRISAFDFVLDRLVPDKGAVLTQLSQWWFAQLDDIVENHVLSDDDVPEQVFGRAVVCERLEMVPVECVARGYLTGSGWLEYQQSGSVCGVALPDGLVDGSRLPEPIFTPATKAAFGEHDENVDFETMVETTGRALGEQLRDLTLAVYARAEEVARESRADPGRHQARVRAPGRRDARARRRGPHPRLLALLGRRDLGAGRPPRRLRQAVHPRLAAARVGLGPRLRRRPAARSPRRSWRPPASATSRRTSG